MRRSVLTVIGIVLAFGVGHLLSNRQTSVLGQNVAGNGFAAVPGARGDQDLTGPYDVDPDWPKPMSQLPNHQNWTWGAVQGIFAESPDRVFIIQRGELPSAVTPVDLRNVREFYCGGHTNSANESRSRSNSQ